MAGVHSAISKVSHSALDGLDKLVAMNGRVLLQTLEKSLLWQRLRQMSEEGAVVEATVEQVRPAGLIVRVTGSDVTGFVPGSHISSVHASAPLHVQI